MVKTLKKLEAKLEALSVRGHSAAAVGSLILLVLVNQVLDRSYAASNHPVGYAEGQTTFSGSEIKGYYAVMEEAGTLDRYWMTQFIDFGFIAAMVLLGLGIGTLLARLNRPGSLFSRLGRATAFLVPLGAGFDVVENLISFVMLSNPQGFSNWVAFPYSLAAVVKFILIGLGMVSALGAACGAVLLRLGVGQGPPAAAAE